ncbi:pyrimidine dimer DNA glycosylase/endonuclease V [Chloroflexota bacterium]
MWVSGDIVFIKLHIIPIITIVMRMWMVDPGTMCRNHLLGEHVECHMFAGTIRRGKNIQGYLDKGLLEIHNIRSRHDELAQEMQRRGYKHKSPLEFVSEKKSGEIDSKHSAAELYGRCRECRRLSLLSR